MRAATKAAFLARIAASKKAESIVVLRLKDAFIADYLIICTATTSLHAKTIADAIYEGAKGKVVLHHMEGNAEGGWVLLDYDDVIVHIFLPEKRDFYKIEELFFDARKVKVKGL